ncbi:MAG: hypothetical protein AB7N91_21505 [Candidatus Tectimicrobiota bacterium]
MMGLVILAIIGLCIGVIVWRRRRSWEAYMTPVAPESVSQTELAHKAFAHGNSCLAAGQFSEAITSFNKTLEIEPKHPHVGGRLAEAERQQAAQAKATA